jgi:NADPH-dependent F420 reductase
MNITIIGTGKMASGIGTRLVTGGNSVTLLGRDLEKGATLVTQLQEAARHGATAQNAPFGSSIHDDVVILAVPYTAEAEIIQQYQAQLAGKIIVEITNPLNATYDGLATPPGSSAAEEIAKMVPTDTRVVKAFNTTFAGTLVAGTVAGHTLDVFIVGDDGEAKAIISQLVEAGGLRAIDAGPLSSARQLEGLGFLGVTLQFTLGTNFMSAWKFLS